MVSLRSGWPGLPAVLIACGGIAVIDGEGAGGAGGRAAGTTSTSGITVGGTSVASGAAVGGSGAAGGVGRGGDSAAGGSSMGGAPDTVSASSASGMAASSAATSVASSAASSAVSTGAASSGSGSTSASSGAGGSGGASPCPVETFGGHEYWLCEDGDPWVAARAFCMIQGGDLTSIQSQAENDFLFDAINQLSNGKWWMGFNDRAAEGTWVWSDGSAVVFTHWEMGEPNNVGGNEDCGQLNRFFPSSTWNDEPCSTALPFVCEFP
jgi:hypothetical protein